MELSGGPETKKARWSPNSFSSPSVATNGASNARDLFANYGYGNQAAVNQAAAFGTNPANGMASNLGLTSQQQQLYSTPSLTVNTATNGVGMAGQMSPSSATSPFPPAMQQQQQQLNGANGSYGAAGFGGYNMNGMLGMGLPGMGMLGVGGFPYSPQIGSFQQVRNPIKFSPVVEPSAHAL